MFLDHHIISQVNCERLSLEVNRLFTNVKHIRERLLPD